MMTEERAVDIVFEEVRLAALSLGHSRQQAVDIASSVDERIRIRLGGEKHYVHTKDKGDRNRRVMARFTGNNQGELAEIFGLSRRTIERIVADAYGNR